MTAKAQKSNFNSDWYVVREYLCINGLRSWFILATVTEPDVSEMGYTDGAIGSAEQRATEIATALNSMGRS